MISFHTFNGSGKVFFCRHSDACITGIQVACDPKHDKINFTGNRFLSEILSQQKQFCPLVGPGPISKNYDKNSNNDSNDNSKTTSNNNYVGNSYDDSNNRDSMKDSC